METSTESTQKLQRTLLTDFKENIEIIRFEVKRIIITLKYFIALSLVLLPAIIFLNSISKDYEALLINLGRENFERYATTSFVLVGQFLMQMMGIMLALDSFGKSTHESMQRYFALPIRRANIFTAHTTTVIIGTILTGFIGILVFDLILWVWTGIAISAILLMKAFLMTFIGAFLAIAVTTMFIVIANYFNFSSSLAIIPTLFLFYIIPFLVNFISDFAFGLPKAYQWTFMYQLAVATDFFIQQDFGLHEVLDWTAKRTAWLTISLVIVVSEIIALIMFIETER
ncbi:MAG: hypothetical protein HZR80_08195 [Candidatus Heimdallarchaeota archaeon]